MRTSMRTFWRFMVTIGRLIVFLLPFLGKYRKTVTVTFGLTSKDQVVPHQKYAELFGTIRESFGLKRIYRFKKDVGKKYLLKTCDASYEHFFDVGFGEKILVEMSVSNVNGASFTVNCKFVDKKTNNLCVLATQKIAYTDLSGRPQRIPPFLKMLLLSIERKKDSKTRIAKEDNSLYGKSEKFMHHEIVTSGMTNAETNVNHDEYAKLIIRAFEVYLLKTGINKDHCRVSVKNAYYKYVRDFFFGDEIMVLFSVKQEDNGHCLRAECFDSAGTNHVTAQLEIA